MLQFVVAFLVSAGFGLCVEKVKTGDEGLLLFVVKNCFHD